jgi:CDP-diacylglycerol--glycerol-3-phosphate 3-phosphatidyltransferase
MKSIPNILSISRIVLSVSLLFLANKHPYVFCVVYLVIGLTDLFDGKIARRLHVESELGSKLDAWGDSMLFGMATISLLLLPGFDFGGWKNLIPLSVAVAYKLANVLVTHARFKEWNMMHTLLNKSVFGTLYFFVPVFLLQRGLNFWIITAYSTVICFACFEETITLMRMESYDVNCHGIFVEKVMKRLKRAS